MAKLFTDSNINFSSSSWKVIDTTSYLNSYAGTTALSTSYTASSTFTPGAITVEGIVIRFVSISATPTGTFSLQLWNSTDSTQAAVVTCNMSDLATIGVKTIAPSGFVYFKFGSPVTLLAGKAYSVRLLTSSAGQATAYRDATGGNWTRMLVTSTTASGAAGDNFFSAGAITGAGSITTNTVTYNITAATVWGSITVCHGSTMVCENSASKNYQLYIASGGTGLSVSGTFEIGNSSTRLDPTSTFVMEAQSAAASGNLISIYAGGMFRAYGTDKVRFARAAADFSVGATSITTNVSTGWKNGDVIGIGTTERAGTPTGDLKSLTADAVGTTLTIAAVAAGKSGTAPVQVPLINLSSNITIRGSSTTNTMYVQLGGRDAGIDVDNCAFNNLGSATTGTRGISIAATATTVNFKVNKCAFNSLHNSCVSFEASGTTTAMAGVVEFTNNVQFSGVAMVSIAAATTSTGFSSAKLEGNVSIYILGGSGFGFNVLDRRFNIKNNIVNASQGTNNFVINTSSNAYTWTQGEISGNMAECCANQGFVLTLINTVISNLTAYRSNAYNFQFLNIYDSKISGLTAFGATTSNMILNAGCQINDFTIDSADVQSGSGNTCPRGIVGAANSFAKNLVISNSNFGTVTPHSTGDVVPVLYFVGDVTFKDSTLASTTQVSGQSNMTRTSSIRIQRSGGVAGTHRTYFRQGRVDSDATIYDPAIATSTKSLRATPSSATEDLYFMLCRMAVPSGQTATLTLKVRKSVVGDGAAYNGNQPKVYMIANSGAGSGFDSDALVMTASNAANGAWETLTYTTPTFTDSTTVDFWVQVDGTTGWVNVDTLRAS